MNRADKRVQLNLKNLKHLKINEGEKYGTKWNCHENTFNF